MDIEATALISSVAAAYPAAFLVERLTETVIVMTPNAVKEPRFSRVRAEMKELGPPVLRGLRDQDGDTVVWRLLEGSHRTHAAQMDRRGLRLVEVQADEVVDVEAYDLVTREALSPRPAQEFADWWPAPVPLRFPRRRVRVLRKMPKLSRKSAA